MGQPNVWLYVKSSNGWVKNVQILSVTKKMVTFRYEYEGESEKRLWEKTTSINNIAEIDVKLLTIPKEEQHLTALRDKLTNLLSNESVDNE